LRLLWLQAKAIGKWGHLPAGVRENIDRWRCMKRQWDIEELIEHFTLIEEDKEVLDVNYGKKPGQIPV
jgi:hypothetical protein